MLRLSVQIREEIDWEQTPKTYYNFTDWQDIVIFAYRLAVKTGREVRVESEGNGHYFNPEYANEYLKVNNPQQSEAKTEI